MTPMEYQKKVKELSVYKKTLPDEKTLPCINPYSPKDIMYTVLGLTGEAGEVANQVKKYIRDDDFVWTTDRLSKVCDELGDTLWYLTAVCNELGFNLGELMQSNIDKLTNRKKKGTLKGDKRDD